MADTTPAAAPDVVDAVKQLEDKLEEMTKDRNAFRTEFQELSKKHDAVQSELTAVKKAKAPPAAAVIPVIKAKDVVIIGGKTHQIIDVTDGDSAMHRLRQNADGCRTEAIWVEVK